MQLKVGDWIVHPNYGVGRIANFGEKQFSGQEARLYYEVNIETGTIWVPAEFSNPPRLRRLTTKGELARYRQLLKSRPGSLDNDHRKRHLYLEDRLREGTFRAICEIARDLTALSWGKPLSQGDAAWLRKVQDSLYREWSLSEGVSVAEAAREIESLFLEARQQFSP